MSLKIVICTNHFAPSIGGCQVVTKKIADYFSFLGHNVSVITRKLKGRNPSSFTSYKIHEYHPNDHRGFLKTIDTIKPDVVLVYSDVFDFFRHLITSTVKYRLIIAPCGCNWAYSNRTFANLIYRNSSKINAFICHSEYDRDYKLCSSGELKNKCHVVPNGVDLNEFNSNKLDRNTLLPQYYEKRWIVNISNFFPGKGQNHMIDILNHLPDPGNYVYIQISSDIEFNIGEQLESEWKKRVVTKLNKSLTTVNKKNLSREEVIGFLKQANALALSSEKEVAPVTILESMAASTPWVSADVGNVRGLKGGRYVTALKDSRYHSVFDDRVKMLFAHALQEVLANPTIGEDGRIQIECNMTWDKILPQYRSIIEK